MRRETSPFGEIPKEKLNRPLYVESPEILDPMASMN
jgi:hypothetical protein